MMLQSFRQTSSMLALLCKVKIQDNLDKLAVGETQKDPKGPKDTSGCYLVQTCTGSYSFHFALASEGSNNFQHHHLYLGSISSQSSSQCLVFHLRFFFSKSQVQFFYTVDTCVCLLMCNRITVYITTTTQANCQKLKLYICQIQYFYS